MSYNLTGAVFIKNCFTGAFCLFESMAQILPLVDEMIVMDCGSVDGTLEALREIASANPKIRLTHGSFHTEDAKVFADLANELIAMATTPHVWYFQSDEIWHERLITITKRWLDEGKRDLTFWRYQLRENFQKIKWFPHPVHRIGPKDNFNFVGDGMNSDRLFEPPVCSTYDGGWFIKWGSLFAETAPEMPTHEMILDVSLVGAFLENIPERRGLHAPYWHEPPTIEEEEGEVWMLRERGNKNWRLRDSPFDIPDIMKFHLGRPRYTLRDSLLQRLKNGGGNLWRV